MEKHLFLESLENHQAVIDILISHRGEDGVCRISKPQLEQELGRRWSWICRAINRINTLDPCIKKVDAGAYLVAYDNLLSFGIFHKITMMLAETAENPSVIHMSTQQLMDHFSCTEKVIQMYRAYALSGWKVAARKNK